MSRRSMWADLNNLLISSPKHLGHINTMLCGSFLEWRICIMQNRPFLLSLLYVDGVNLRGRFMRVKLHHHSSMWVILSLVNMLISLGYFLLFLLLKNLSDWVIIWLAYLCLASRVDMWSDTLNRILEVILSYLVSISRGFLISSLRFCPFIFTLSSLIFHFDKKLIRLKRIYRSRDPDIKSSF